MTRASGSTRTGPFKSDPTVVLSFASDQRELSARGDIRPCVRVSPATTDLPVTE